MDSESEGSIYKVTQYCKRFCTFQKHKSSLCCLVTLHILHSLSWSTELRNRNYGTYVPRFRFCSSIVPWTRKVKKVYIGRHNTAEGIVNSKNTKALYAVGSPYIYYLHSLCPRNYGTGTTSLMCFRFRSSVDPKSEGSIYKVTKYCRSAHTSSWRFCVQQKYSNFRHKLYNNCLLHSPRQQTQQLSSFCFLSSYSL